MSTPFLLQVKSPATCTLIVMIVLTGAVASSFTGIVRLELENRGSAAIESGAPSWTPTSP